MSCLKFKILFLSPFSHFSSYFWEFTRVERKLLRCQNSLKLPSMDVSRGNWIVEIYAWEIDGIRCRRFNGDTAWHFDSFFCVCKRDFFGIWMRISNFHMKEIPCCLNLPLPLCGCGTFSNVVRLFACGWFKILFPQLHDLIKHKSHLFVRIFVWK